MWHLKAIIIPVVVGALGMIKKKTKDRANSREPLSARIANDGNDWDGSFTVTCTTHVTDYAVLTQSED